jgi:hypothetical protein
LKKIKFFFHVNWKMDMREYKKYQELRVKFGHDLRKTFSNVKTLLKDFEKLDNAKSYGWDNFYELSNSEVKDLLLQARYVLKTIVDKGDTKRE